MTETERAERLRDGFRAIDTEVDRVRSSKQDELIRTELASDLGDLPRLRWEGDPVTVFLRGHASRADYGTGELVKTVVRYAKTFGGEVEVHSDDHMITVETMIGIKGVPAVVWGAVWMANEGEAKPGLRDVEERVTALTGYRFPASHSVREESEEPPWDADTTCRYCLRPTGAGAEVCAGCMAEHVAKVEAMTQVVRDARAKTQEGYWELSGLDETTETRSTLVKAYVVLKDADVLPEVRTRFREAIEARFAAEMTPAELERWHDIVGGPYETRAEAIETDAGAVEAERVWTVRQREGNASEQHRQPVGWRCALCQGTWTAMTLHPCTGAEEWAYPEMPVYEGEEALRDGAASAQDD